MTSAFLSGKADQGGVVWKYLQSIQFIRRRALGTIDERQETRKIGIAEILCPERPVNIVSAKVGQLDARRQAAIGEEWILDNVLEAEVRIPFPLKEGVLHGNGMIELLLGVVHDNEAVVAGVELVKKLLNPLQQKFIRFFMERFRSHMVVQLSFVDNHRKDTYVVLFDL